MCSNPWPPASSYQKVLLLQSSSSTFTQRHPPHHSTAPTNHNPIAAQGRAPLPRGPDRLRRRHHPRQPGRRLDPPHRRRRGAGRRRRRRRPDQGVRPHRAARRLRRRLQARSRQRAAAAGQRRRCFAQHPGLPAAADCQPVGADLQRRPCYGELRWGVRVGCCLGRNKGMLLDVSFHTFLPPLSFTPTLCPPPRPPQNTQPKATNSRYIVRFKDAQPLSLATSLCSELKGAAPGAAQRFRGFCDQTFFKLQPASATHLDWKFLPVTLKGAVSLAAGWAGYYRWETATQGASLKDQHNTCCFMRLPHPQFQPPIPPPTQPTHQTRTTSPPSASSTPARSPTSRPT